MQLNFFYIPVSENKEQTNEVNAFLRSHKIIDIEKQFVSNSNNSFWSLCIRYIEGVSPTNTQAKQEKVDYKTVLDEATFKVFSQLRLIRKQIAEADAVPAYAVFTDEELSQIAKLSEITNANMLTIKGIGLKKVEKYGIKIQEMIKPKAE